MPVKLEREKKMVEYNKKDSLMRKAGRFVRSPLFAVLSLLFMIAFFTTFLANYASRKVFARLNVIKPVEATVEIEKKHKYDNVKTELIQDFKIYKAKQEKKKEFNAYKSKREKQILNILLLGVDSRDPDAINERSDAMMILSVDQAKAKLKLISLQRDMLCYVPGSLNLEKLTHMNAIGGPEMTLAAVNDILRLSIDKYAVVNMRRMENLIDLAGGIKIDVEESCLKTMNWIINCANRNFPETEKAREIKRSGKQHLNGRQAVSYARNRTDSLGEFSGDYARMYRQRIVLQALMDKFMDLSNSERLEIMGEAMSMVTTNLEPSEIVSIATSILPVINRKIEQMQIPIEGYYISVNSFAWVNLCDFNGMIPKVQEFIYGKTMEFEPVVQIPGAPGSVSTNWQYVPIVQSEESEVPADISSEDINPDGEIFDANDSSEQADLGNYSNSHDLPESNSQSDYKHNSNNLNYPNNNENTAGVNPFNSFNSKGDNNNSGNFWQLPWQNTAQNSVDNSSQNNVPNSQNLWPNGLPQSLPTNSAYDNGGN